MSQGNLDAEQMLELYVFDYLVTRNLAQTAMSFMVEARITTDTASGFDQGTSGFLSGWDVPSTGTQCNMDHLGINIFRSGGLDEIVSLKNQALTQQPQHQQQHQYSQQQQQQLQYQQQQLQYQQQQQNLQQQYQQQQQQNLQQLRVKQQQQQQEELLQEQRKQPAFAQQSQIQLQQQEARKRRKPTSATETGTSENPGGHFYPSPLLRSSIGTPAGPTTPLLMTPGVGLSLARDSGNPVDPPVSSTGTPGFKLPLVRVAGNLVGASSTVTPGDGLPSVRDLAKGSGT